ncbi:hypothetical protein Tco_0323992, partial [Tanacetum coccineum]
HDLVSRVSALEHVCANFEKRHKLQDKTVQGLSFRVFDLELHDLPYKIDETVREVMQEAVHVALQALLIDRFRDLPEADIKEILHQRMFESGSYKSHPEHVALYEALEASMEHAQRDKFLAEMANSSKQKSVPHSKQPVKDVPIPDDVNISYSEDTYTTHLPKIKTLATWLRPLQEEDIPESPEPDCVIPPNDLPETESNWVNALASSYQDLNEYKLLRQTGYMSSFINWFCKRIGKKKSAKADLEGPTFKVVQPFHDNIISLQFQMEECYLLLTNQIDLVNPEGHRVVPDVSKPLPLGGPPGDKGRRSALSISKLKAAQYLDFGLKELVPSLWIESEREYDISAAYGISHWWFKCKEFYITRHSASSDRSTVRSHMRILSVVSLKTYERYGYTFLKEIVLRRADYKEYKISEADFKNLHPNDFKDLYLLHLQADFLFKEDYTIVSKPRAVIYRDRNDQKKMMRETKVHKYNNGTLNRILDKLDHMVKNFKLFKYNPGMETRIWSEDDRRRSKAFMEVIKRRLKIRRIFRSLISFVGGRLRDVDYILIQRTE